MNWAQHAACQGMDEDLFFPEGRGHVAIEAYQACNGCPVREPCLEEAINRQRGEDHGIWGGTSEQDRVQIRLGRITRRQAMQRGNRRSVLQRCGCGAITHREGPCGRCRTTRKAA